MTNLGIPVSHCTGCAACANICKMDAIQMNERKDGFTYPGIDGEKCVHCDRCLEVCRKWEQCSAEASDEPAVYAMLSKNDEVRLHSTSGGIFSELAACILKRGGRVVGAVYRPDWSVEHQMIESPGDLEKIRRSKYQQSNINLIYREIKSALKADQKVLFCGTPCQVGGLKAFLGKEFAGLYTCDFICRGVSSPKLFAKYIGDLKDQYNSDVAYVWMKNKCNGWHELTTAIGFENGETYIKKGLEDSYVQMYLKYNMGVRESCYSCRFKKRDAADITLGDFWGLDGTAMDDNLGTSVVICRTQKGRALVDGIKENVYYQDKQIEDVKRSNPCLYSSIGKSTGDAEKFYDILEREGYQRAYRWLVGEAYE